MHGKKVILENRCFIARVVFFAALSAVGSMQVGARVEAKDESGRKPCGYASVEGHEDCATAVVRMHLGECERGGGVVTAQVRCSGESGTAVYESQKARYEIQIRKYVGSMGDVAWDAVGSLRRVRFETRKPAAEPAPVVSPSPVAAVAAPSVAATPIAAPSPATTPVPPPSTGTLPFQFKGSARFRQETWDKSDYSTNRSQTLLRLRPELWLSPSADLDAVLIPQVAKTFGETVVVGSTTEKNVSVDTSGGVVDPPLLVHEAYVNYHPWGAWELVLGRQVLSYGNELVIGGLDWVNNGRKFDAIRARAKPGDSGVFTDFLAAKLQDNNFRTSGPGDKDLFGAYSSWSPASWAKSVDVYLLLLRNSAVSPANLWTTGVRAQSPVGWLDYRIEVTAQGGLSHGYQGDLEVGATLSDGAPKPRISVEGWTASAGYNQLFPTAHKWLGFVDVFGRRNISGAAVHLSSSIVGGLSASLDLHYFMRTSQDAPAYQLNGATALGKASASSSRQLGTEADLVLRYQITPKLFLHGGGGLLFPGNYLRDQFGGKRPDFYYVSLDVKF